MIRRALLFVTAGLLLAGGQTRAAVVGQSMSDWVVETSPAGKVSMDHGVMDIDVPDGTSVWLKQELKAPVVISFEVMAVSAGGPQDRVSDVNAFWMATDSDGSSPVGERDGTFAQYDTLKTYYVGIGGNYNSTTRMRRYIGRRDDRPLLPQHDLADAKDMLVPNQWMTVTLIADGHGASVLRDGKTVFEMPDAEPYTQGWFALRTTKSHLRVRNVRVAPLAP